jgi:hypothetical protein
VSSYSSQPPIEGYPLDRLYEEVAFVAYHFNWSHDEVLALPHWERRRWCEEISAINERMSDGGQQGLTGSKRSLQSLDSIEPAGER